MEMKIGQGMMESRMPVPESDEEKSTINAIVAMMKGKGKGGKGGKRSHRRTRLNQAFATSGKGFGRQNPIDPATGEPGKRHNCGKTDHFIGECPTGKGKGKTSPSFQIYAKDTPTYNQTQHHPATLAGPTRALQEVG